MGIRDRPISARSPWQNGVAERLIGSIRRDCLDHVVIFSEQHLRHLLSSYQEYYNKSRTHLSLKKDAPIPRDAQSVGRVLALPILGGIGTFGFEYPTGTATRAANNGATVAELEAVSGWNGGRMASLYTRAADRARLAKGAMAKLDRTPSEHTISAPAEKVREPVRKDQ
jgi:hypothetical protein